VMKSSIDGIYQSQGLNRVDSTSGLSRLSIGTHILPMPP